MKDPEKLEEPHFVPSASRRIAIQLEDWPFLTLSKRKKAFKGLPAKEREELFLNLKPAYQREVLKAISPAEERTWLRLLPPDEAADLIQELPVAEREEALALLDEQTRLDVTALMKYEEDRAGGLMSPRFARLRPDMAVEEAISYLRAQARSRIEIIYYGYVLDAGQHLLGVVSLHELVMAPSEKKVSEIMRTDFISVPEEMEPAQIARLFSQHGLLAIPVLDSEKRMNGIVTPDDVMGAVLEEATSDIQKLGGTEVLDAPYLTISFFKMLKKRAGWLMALFLGEMLTATAMGYYEKEIERAVVLALFIPLIISSGGNSGSQATTLIIRAMALGEVRIRDWWRVLLKELSTGIALGIILGSIGLIRILLWPARAKVYGEHYVLIAVTVAGSLVGVVLWGATMGSMLPFLLRRLGFDPATSSAPFVATLVDVTGLIIYFTVASVILSGTLL